MNKLNKTFDILKNMGWRYICYRVVYELNKRTGNLKRKFPVSPEVQEFLSLEQWRKQPTNFFFYDKEELKFEKVKSKELQERFDSLRSGKFLLFNNLLTDLGTDYDWVTNPDTDYRYDVTKHWTEIKDFSPTAGDIKYVWEKSRFSYLYDIIRYDYHFEADCSDMVFNDILSWINTNPVNCGPNYYCSQEISLRTLNWLFALHYYRNSKTLTTEIFIKIQHVIYWQLHHVYNNINFSRIAVRNNHAITETLTLYLAGVYFPSFPQAAIWKKKGKQWFEKEIAYQIYEDGTYLQHSMNYHRVVVQLLTWGIVLSEKNGERFSDVVYDRARKSVQFLRVCMNAKDGFLPNYGMNDGALFFKFNECNYRDYRPSIDALATALKMDAYTIGNYEDVSWYCLTEQKNVDSGVGKVIYSFNKGGYYVIRENDSTTFIRCCNYKDRPHQADNLHLDIWYKGENILLDGGSYKYNADMATLKYFGGTASHNSVMLGNNDQMLKGGRFIWYYWTQCEFVNITEEDDWYLFSGTIKTFRFIDKNIRHRRTVKKYKGKPIWEVTDEIIGKPENLSLNQLWHSPRGIRNKLKITAKYSNGQAINPIIRDGFESSYYGRKEKTKEIVFNSSESKISTVIEVMGE